LKVRQQPMLRTGCCRATETAAFRQKSPRGWGRMECQGKDLIIRWVRPCSLGRLTHSIHSPRITWALTKMIYMRSASHRKQRFALTTTLRVIESAPYLVGCMRIHGPNSPLAIGLLQYRASHSFCRTPPVQHMLSSVHSFSVPRNEPDCTV
jgi:hypothetical protein